MLLLVKTTLDDSSAAMMQAELLQELHPHQYRQPVLVQSMEALELAAKVAAELNQGQYPSVQEKLVTASLSVRASLWGRRAQSVDFCVRSSSPVRAA